MKGGYPRFQAQYRNRCRNPLEWPTPAQRRILKLKFEAVKQMDEEEQKSVISILDAMILKHQARLLVGRT